MDPFLKPPYALKAAGAAWTGRLDEAQKPLARQLCSLLGHQIHDRVLQIAERVAGRSTGTALHVITFDHGTTAVQGPSAFGHLTSGTPSFANPAVPEPETAMVFMSNDGVVRETPAGDTSALPSDMVLHEQTLWFIRRDPGVQPVALMAGDKTLIEGSGFLVSGGWIVLFECPFELWPEGVIPAMAKLDSTSCLSTTLRTDRLRTGGRQIALYRRQTQNLRQFQRALCEVAGITVFDTDGWVRKMETTPTHTLHWLEDGRFFSLPGSSPYVVGSMVPAGSGHILEVRHQSLQGPAWWAGRPWGDVGIPIWVFRPDFFGFSVRDRIVPAEGWDDGTAVRVRAVTGQHPEYEALFWERQARLEANAGTTLWADITGISTEGEQAPVNLLEKFTGLCGPWFGVIETSLDSVDPEAFRAVSDFIDRERPAGSQWYLAGSSSLFTERQVFDVYLNTGELVLTDDDYIVAIPASH